MAAVAYGLAQKVVGREPFQTADSVAEQAKELRGILEDHARLPVVLIGHSWGAWLSPVVAGRYPGLVRKLVLVASGPFEASLTYDDDNR
jgi:pimeloyl-ACP methyl ester carboxylesterase